VLPLAKPTSLAYRGTAHPDIITGLVFAIVNEVHALGALGNEVLRYCVNNTRQTINIFPRGGEIITNLIIALWAPVLHTVSWQKAVSAVSGDEILEEVTVDLTLMSLFEPSSSGVEGMADGAGKQVS
jgi:hypothetical protein